MLAGAVLAASACGGTTLTRSGQSLGPIVWNGIDSRPLAIGTDLRITFESSDATACCQSGYEVRSSDPTLLSVQDLGGQWVSIQGIASGFAEVQVLSQSQLVGRLGIAARQPVQIALSDPSHLAAGIDVPLPSAFAVQTGSLELVAIQVTDDRGDALAFSPPLLAVNSSGTIDVTLQSGATLAIAGQQGGQQGCFDVELASANPATGSFGCAALSHAGWPIYQVSVVEAPASVTLGTRKLSTTPEETYAALAIALGADGITEVLGVESWNFSLAGPGTLIPIAPAAVELVFPTGAPSQSSSLSVTDRTVRAFLSVPP